MYLSDWFVDLYLLQVQQALNNIMQEHTMLVVAHRLSTVEKANNIIVIDRGCVAEQGSHAQLMARGGIYSKLVQRQLLGIETGAEVLNPPKELSWKSDGGRQRRRQSSSASEAEITMRYWKGTAVCGNGIELLEGSLQFGYVGIWAIGAVFCAAIQIGKGCQAEFRPQGNQSTPLKTCILIYYIVEIDFNVSSESVQVKIYL